MTADFKRLILISVGTSIYTSLCWKPEAFDNNPLYSEWAGDDALKREPKRRMRTEGLEEFFISRLTKDNADLLAASFAGEHWHTEEFRYSAELTTLIKLAKDSYPANPQLWSQEAQYGFIYDACQDKGGSHIAALHNVACLRTWADIESGAVSAPLIFPNLESDKTENFAFAQMEAMSAARRAAEDFLKTQREVYFVVSGGFKIAACLAGAMMPYGTQIGYQHDTVGSIYKQVVPPPTDESEKRRVILHICNRPSVSGEAN